MKEERKKLSGAEKVGLIRRHLVEGEEVSKVCEEGGISPRQFYRWQQELFEGGAEVLDGQCYDPHCLAEIVPNYVTLGARGMRGPLVNLISGIGCYRGYRC